MDSSSYSAGYQTVPWSTGLCGCFSDTKNCCLTCLCPCITYCRVVDIIDRGNNTNSNMKIELLYGAVSCAIQCFLGIPCGPHGHRTKMREQYSLQESPCGDCLVHSCCDPCALCQEYRELQNRGFDMSLGWEGNVAKQRSEVAMAPVVQGGMIR